MQCPGRPFATVAESGGGSCARRTAPWPCDPGVGQSGQPIERTNQREPPSKESSRTPARPAAPLRLGHGRRLGHGVQRIGHGDRLRGPPGRRQAAPEAPARPFGHGRCTGAPDLRSCRHPAQARCALRDADAGRGLPGHVHARAAGRPGRTHPGAALAPERRSRVSVRRGGDRMRDRGHPGTGQPARAVDGGGGAPAS